MSHHAPDMNHDGKIDSHDSALFHEMLGENSSNSPSSSNEPWTVYHSIAKGLMLLFFGGFIFLLFQDVIPLNGFTAVLTLISAVCFLRTLML